MRLLSHLLPFAAGGLLGFGWQDPPPAASPANPAGAANPAGPAATETPAKDAGSHPLEGVYLLRSRTIGGTQKPQRSRGYVAITKRHMLICLVAEGPDPKLPLLRAGVRNWQPDRDNFYRTEYRLGFYSDAEGGIHVDPPGNAEVKRIDIERGLLRIWQDDRSHLEFERIE